MAHIIAGIYEIREQIGAGGGGVVYLGHHLRLDKKVVLKADKRTLNTKAESLRREVDMLKGLSHTYIPQVYDFVQEDGVVYTVMEFIEGESLDKLLNSQTVPTQPQVIQWACQLLEALCYLHSRPPHGILHGDIKPANIMLRTGGDICLIDYNIALALGEDGAVKIGFSRGYASPEHYGMGAVNSQLMTEQRADVLPILQRGTEDITETGMVTETIGMSETVISEKKAGTVSGGFPPLEPSCSRASHSVMLDVRSDIYSLGATLYHLLSGRRPPQDANGVESLGLDICSVAVSNILKKAMAPNPDMRYQTAKEMLAAFRQLHKRDGRVVKRKRRAIISIFSIMLLFLTGGACAFIGLKQLEGRQNALAQAEYSANALAEGDVVSAVERAMRAIPDEANIFAAPVTAQAQYALTNALGVYDLSDGFKPLNMEILPSAPFKIKISPKGTRFAAVYQYEAAIFDTESRSKVAVLPMEASALSDVVFVDEGKLVYAGNNGVTAYDLDTREALWSGDAATTLSVSADKTTVAAVNRDEQSAAIYRLSDGEKVKVCSFDGNHLPIPANDIFADPDDNIFALNKDGSMLAVSFSDGALRVFDLDNPEEDLILYDESEYSRFEGGFCGKYFAFTAGKSGAALFGLIDIEKAVYVGGYDSKDPLLLETDEQGIYLSNQNLLVGFAPDTLTEAELAYTNQANIIGFSKSEGYILTATDNQGFSFYDSGANLMSSETGKENCDFTALAGGYAVVGNRNEPSVRILKLENHTEAQLLSYDAHYAHDEARISQDGKTAMLFSYQEFRIYDMAGQVLKQVELQDSEHIYDQQFVRSKENSWLEVIWYDGMIRRYSAASGALIDEVMSEPPTADLHEEFYTDKYRFTSPLHGVPEVYDIQSNQLKAVLEKDSYLTYVTQIGEYIITEYISASGERYGLLLNDKLQTLAHLPRLCDIVNGNLIFDYESGNLRQCRLYSLQELKTLGAVYKE